MQFSFLFPDFKNNLTSKNLNFTSMLSRRLLLSILVLSAFFAAKAQQPKPDYKGDSEFDLKNYKADPRDRVILETNYTNWLGAPKGIKTDWKCIGFAFASMFDKPLGKSNFRSEE